MDGISNGMRAVEIMLRSGFFMVLAVTAFQDCRERRIRVSVFVIFGTAGIVLRGVELFLEINALSGDWESVDLWGFAARRILDVGAAMAVGGGMLLLSAMTRGAIGRGDGLFFSVSGRYIGHKGSLCRAECPQTLRTLFAVFGSWRNRGDVSMNRPGEWVEGSFTVEAACIMAMVLLSLSVMIRQAGYMRDETVGMISLHEAVEKGRHEKGLDLDGAASAAEGYMGNPRTFSEYKIGLSQRGIRVSGKGQGGRWSYEIQGKRFRPEMFLRKITLIEGLGEEDGN